MSGSGCITRLPSSVLRRPSSVEHAERMHISLEDRLLLLALVGVLLAQPHDRAQSLDVEAVRLGFGIDVADIVGDGLLLFLEPLDALHEGFEVILRKAGGGLFLDGGSSG